MTKFKPWTFEPFEVYDDPTWTILDPNQAQIVAIFYDADEAKAYLKWRNKKQAKAKAKLAKTKAKMARLYFDDPDDDC